MTSLESPLDRRRGKMILADGARFDGYLTGSADLPVLGEVVFNTSMTGYQEIITDPSYAGQILVMTYPQIGNYGVCPADNERNTCAARALVVRELSPFFSPGHDRISLEEFMVTRGLPGLTGVDTRALTKHIRSRGAVMAAIGGESHSEQELKALANSQSFSRGQSLVESVTGSLSGVREATKRRRAAVVDLGVKQSILDQVHALGVSTRIFHARSLAGEILEGGFDFVVLSNGPGDPTDVPRVIEQVQQLIGKIPILGICLGHQITALAMGGSTFKLKFGHHGANQPVVDRRTGRVFITSQNHGYAVADDIGDRSGVDVTFTNASDGTLEGFTDENLMVECVQFHPEAAPGPRDTSFVFRSFLDKVREAHEINGVKGWRDDATIEAPDTVNELASGF